MRIRAVSSVALSASVASAILAACGGSQPPIGAPGAMPESGGDAARSFSSPSILPEAKAHYRKAHYHVVYSFTGDPDGAGSSASLLALNGKLYGTTWVGGVSNDGTVFALTRQGKETVIYSFSAGTDGSNPGAGLINVNGTLYGTTVNGGTANDGTVFAVTTSGKERVLHSFGSNSGDGENPNAALLDVNGALYGTTENGGAFGGGTVFKMTTSGKEKLLHSFGASEDGANPLAALINVNGRLYGTTLNGGVSYKCYYSNHDPTCGTVFSITPSGKERVLHSFKGGNDGQNPRASMINVNGTLYGTTVRGELTCGTVFKITTSGKATTLYSFGANGCEPFAGLVEVKGDLYGTTFLGGTGCYSSINCGTIFKVTTSGKETVLYNFCTESTSTGCGAGEGPLAGLIYIGGKLYGTTSGGGIENSGVVFSQRP